jgi:hypothetical protein
MCKTFDETLGELRVTQAYIKLLSITEKGTETGIVSLARIGNYEIRILEGSKSGSDSESLIWMELFDHDAQMSIDSFRCREIEDALAVFRDFVAQTNPSNDAQGPEGNAT